MVPLNKFMRRQGKGLKRKIMNQEKKYLTTSEKQTFNLGKKLTNTFKGGDILALSGSLGAGKTIMAKGIAAGLGIKKIITSPTFVLMKVYSIKAKSYKLIVNKLVHIDCYRILNPQEIIDIGAVEYFGRPDTIVVIEWAEKIKNILPRQIIKINIKLKKNNEREIIIN